MEATMEQHEAYVAIDADILRIVRELLAEELAPAAVPTVRISAGTLQLLLRLARIDHVDGRIVVGARLVRNLDPAERGFGSI
jgi:hypothetical protein